MKRTPLRRRSRREAAAAPVRESLVMEVGQCERCGHGQLSHLQVHEIVNAHGRQKTLDNRGAVLVLCGYCHRTIHARGQAGKLESLALLLLSRRDDYDLAEIHRLRGDRWPDERDVAKEAARIMADRGELLR